MIAELSGEIQAIFDAMLKAMGTEYRQLSCTATQDGGGVSMSAATTDHGNSTWTVTRYKQGVRIQLSPVGANLGPGEQVQFTAAAFNPDGSPAAGTFTWSLPQGGLGSITPAGLYSAPAAIAANSSDTLRCELAGTVTWVQAVVSLHP